MGVIYTARCNNCNKIYNYDVGIGLIYSENTLLDLNSEFNILSLFKEHNRKEELINLIKNHECHLENGYGQKICKCDTCGGLYSKFVFKLKTEDGKEFTTKYRCHTCRRKLRTLTEEEILKEKNICPICKNEIVFYESGTWD